jgi:hypothetical protein
MLGIFKYNQNTGAVLFEVLNSDLTVGPIAWGPRIAKGWNITPFYPAIQPINVAMPACYLLLYNPASGAVQIQEATSTGLELIWQGEWSCNPPWTHFVPVWEPGFIPLSGDRCMFSFKEATGEAALDKFNSSGKGTTNIFTQTWKQRWTCFASGNFEGSSGTADPYLLMYAASTGHAELDRLTDEDVVCWAQTWSNTPPWTHMEPLSGSWMFYYKQGDGTVEVDGLSWGGNFPPWEQLWKSQWSTGWTNFSAFNAWTESLLPAPYLLSYKAGDGSLALDKWDGWDPVGFSSMWTSKAGPDWSHVFVLRI